jgi:hypothetical protein
LALLRRELWLHVWGLVESRLRQQQPWPEAESTGEVVCSAGEVVCSTGKVVCSTAEIVCSTAEIVCSTAEVMCSTAEIVCSAAPQPGEPLRRMLHDLMTELLATLASGCKFVLGEPTANVLQAVSLAAMQVAPHGLGSSSSSSGGGGGGSSSCSSAKVDEGATTASEVDAAGA